MIREIVKDPIFLQQKSAPASEADVPVGLDLLDTLHAHRETCVGLAANMIGVSRRIIVFDDSGTPCLMFNPEIVQSSGPYEAEEGCLSLTGTRKARRFRKIKVRYQDERFRVRFRTLEGWTAQIAQHENRPLQRRADLISSPTPPSSIRLYFLCSGFSSLIDTAPAPCYNHANLFRRGG